MMYPRAAPAAPPTQRQRWWTLATSGSRLMSATPHTRHSLHSQFLKDITKNAVRVWPAGLLLRQLLLAALALKVEPARGSAGRACAGGTRSGCAAEASVLEETAELLEEVARRLVLLERVRGSRELAWARAQESVVLGTSLRVGEYIVRVRDCLLFVSSNPTLFSWP